MNNNIPFAYMSIREEHGNKVIVAAAPVATKAGEVVGAVFIEYDAASPFGIHSFLSTVITTSRHSWKR